MSGAHPEIGAELRRLAQAILDGIDPAVRSAAALTAGDGVGTGKCQQVWCPVCARSVDDPLVCGDCSAVICRACGTPLESPDELAFG